VVIKFKEHINCLIEKTVWLHKLLDDLLIFLMIIIVMTTICLS